MNVLCGCCVNMLVVDSPSHAQLITDLVTQPTHCFNFLKVLIYLKISLTQIFMFYIKILQNEFILWKNCA